MLHRHDILTPEDHFKKSRGSFPEFHTVKSKSTHNIGRNNASIQFIPFGSLRNSLFKQFLWSIIKCVNYLVPCLHVHVLLVRGGGGGRRKRRGLLCVCLPASQPAKYTAATAHQQLLPSTQLAKVTSIKYIIHCSGKQCAAAAAANYKTKRLKYQHSNRTCYIIKGNEYGKKQ